MATDVTCLQCGKPYDASVVANRFAGVCPACLAKFAAPGPDEVEQSPGIADPSFKPPLKLGGTFHGLEIVELLGAGGMGVVYKARQPGLDRHVALKVLSPRLSTDRDFISRFNREARAMAALSHAGIVQVFDHGQEADLCFLVMEYVDGLSLRQLMKDRKLAPEEALKVVPKICEALEYAHSKGVIHRDIKPENILLDREGRVKIADFGLARVMDREGGARVTASHVVMGTPGYMAPEQYESMSVDHRADIYSLGAVFYEMLTGQLPVGRFQPPSAKVQIDVRLDEIVLKALATEPAHRYQRAGDVRTDVETVAGSRPPFPAAPMPGHQQLGVWLSICGLIFSSAAIFLIAAKPRLDWFEVVILVGVLLLGCAGAYRVVNHLWRGRAPGAKPDAAPPAPAAPERRIEAPLSRLAVAALAFTLLGVLMLGAAVVIPQFLRVRG